MKRVLLAVVLSSALAPSRAAGCPGDCSRDGLVSVDELIAGVGIALGRVPTDRCPDMDRGGDGAVTVDDLLAAVDASVNGCPHATPTPRVNRPPALQAQGLYRAFPAYPIALPIRAADPDGDPLRFSAAGLPAGAQLDGETGVLSWMPTEADLGTQCFPVTVADTATPPLSAQGRIALQVSPLDACTVPLCDPAAGCTSSLRPLAENCCAAGPVERIAEPLLACPEGRVLLLGRNRSGFGALGNCDRMKVKNFAQIGAVFEFHIAVRCLNGDDQVHLHARLEILERRDNRPGLIFDEQDDIFLDPLDLGDDGFAGRTDIVFPVIGPGPFYEFEGAEALFSVEVTDADGVSARRDLRVVLTFEQPEDLPEASTTMLGEICSGVTRTGFARQLAKGGPSPFGFR